MTKNVSIGSTPITGVYVGGALATGLYVGSNKIWPASGSSGPTLVQQLFGQWDTVARSDRALTFPATATSGNRILIPIWVAGINDIPTTIPPGYTLIASGTLNANNAILWYSKISDGTETGVTFAWTSSDSRALGMQEWTTAGTVGTATYGRIKVADRAMSETLGPSAAAPSATAKVALFAAFAGESSNQVITFPSGWTGVPDTDIGNARVRIGAVAYTNTAPNAAASAQMNYALSPTGTLNWSMLWLDT